MKKRMDPQQLIYSICIYIQRKREREKRPREESVIGAGT